MAGKRLHKSRDRVIAGVCGGLAEYLGWDITAVRIIYALLTVFTAFSGAIIYIILMLLMPEE
ncbi:MAG: PspC domain-containing protein [bacterium]|uniref:PspC domain-containing protein n=1 Tax=Candidatus Aphodosoma intestinipullorum TaxID=2840674 RepID=A0A940IEY0_9BACT|nr:PspC domain-containing protein [Candidatus Aphodosoma intestinipullorum]